VPIIIFSAQAVEKDILKQVGAALVKSTISNNELVAIIKKLTAPLGTIND